MRARTDVNVMEPGRRGLLRYAPVRYLMVGGGLFALDLMIFLLMVTLVGASVWFAQVVARLVGAAAGFVGHRVFSFGEPGREQAASVPVQGAGYLGVTALNVALSPLVVEGAVWVIPSSMVLAKVCAEAVIVTETFLLLRLVFRPGETRDA